eukprot:gene10724-14401_t
MFYIPSFTTWTDQEVPTNLLLRKKESVAKKYLKFKSSIVSHQIKHLKKTGAYDLLSSIKYNVVGNHDYHINDTKFEHIEYLSSGYEDKTLSSLYQYCNNNPNDIVLYFHPKGCFTEAGTDKAHLNYKFRSMLNNFVLHTHCYDALVNDGFNICGPRLSPLPHIHYSGNFWWAKCNYVNTLVNPAIMSDITDIKRKINKLFFGLSDPNLGMNRFFSETWIGSGATVNAADCIPHDVGLSYMYGYTLSDEIMGLVDSSKINPDNHKSIVCQQAIEQMIIRNYLWDNSSSHGYQHPNGLLSLREKYGDIPGKSNPSRNLNDPFPGVCTNTHLSAMINWFSDNKHFENLTSLIDSLA